MQNFRLSLFGGFAIKWAKEPSVAFESDKARMLLAYLAMEADHLHRRESLVGLFWPDKPESLARHSLSQSLSSLKKLLQVPGAPTVDIDAQQIRLILGDAWLDIHEFNALFAACEGHDHPLAWACRPCLDRLERLIALYRGDFLAGCSLKGCAAFEEWLVMKREAFHQKAIQACQQLSHGFEVLGEIEKAVQYAIKHVTLDPLDETAHRQVMQLLARQGQRAEALEQYAACRRVLEEELGAEPEGATQALYQRIMAETVGKSPPPAPPHNLPVPLAPLIGREKELEQVCHRLSSPACRLLTVLGAGGTGKSHLALEAGHLLLPAFPDGVFLVVLDTQQTGQSLAPLIAGAIGLKPHPGSLVTGSPDHVSGETMPAQLLSYLSNKSILLILDGFEGALHETNWVSGLLRRVPGLKILITSRARLNLESERIFLLEGLPYPPQEGDVDLSTYSAVQLFVEGAQRSAPEFALTGSNQGAVSEICRLTQGLPLGLLLAASWVGTLTPAQIVQEIRRSLDFLVSAWQDLPDRQRSLRATFNHSWRLLTAAEQAVFLRLALFHTSFTSQRAAQVAGATLENLRTLINQSLLMHLSTASPQPNDRYRLHDLLRQYALEKLTGMPTENLAAHEQHSQVHLSMLAAWEPRLKSRDQPAALAEMSWEYADLRVAWDWAVDHLQVERLQGAFEALGYYHLLRSLFAELAALCQAAMPRLEAVPFTLETLRLYIHMAAWLTDSLRALAENERAYQVLEQVDVTLQGWGGSLAGMRRQLALLHFARGQALGLGRRNYLYAKEEYQQGLELMMQGEDPWDISYALCKVASIHDLLGNVDATGRVAADALAIQQALGDPNVLSQILQQQSYYYMLSGQSEASLQAVQERNAQLLLSDNSLRNQATALADMGLALLYSGQFEQGKLALEQARKLLSLPEQAWLRESLYYFILCMGLHLGHYAAVLKDTEYVEEALSLNNLAMLNLLKAYVHLLDTHPQESDAETVSSSLSQAERELSCWLNFHRALPRLDMLGEPRALLGYIAYRRGDMDGALQYLEQALCTGIEQGHFYTFLLSLSVLALMLAEAGDLEQAAELYATVSAHPIITNSQWQYELFGRHIRALTSALPAETIAAAQRRGCSRHFTLAGQQYLEKLKIRQKMVVAELEI